MTDRLKIKRIWFNPYNGHVYGNDKEKNSEDIHLVTVKPAKKRNFFRTDQIKDFNFKRITTRLPYPHSALKVKDIPVFFNR